MKAIRLVVVAVVRVCGDYAVYGLIGLRLGYSQSLYGCELGYLLASLVVFCLTVCCCMDVLLRRIEVGRQGEDTRRAKLVCDWS